jgi:hypothetical protein
MLDIVLFGSVFIFVHRKLHWNELQRWHDDWFDKWEEISVAKPLMATAIEYLKTGDENVLLELQQEERVLLRQVLGLDAKPITG